MFNRLRHRLRSESVAPPVCHGDCSLSACLRIRRLGHVVVEPLSSEAALFVLRRLAACVSGRPEVLHDCSPRDLGVDGAVGAWGGGPVDEGGLPPHFPVNSYLCSPSRVFGMNSPGRSVKRQVSVDEGVFMFDAVASLVVTTLLVATPNISVGVLDNGNGERGIETHCVVFVVDQESDGELITTDPECFADPLDAEAWVTVGWQLAHGPEALFDGMGGVSTLATFTLGRHYDGFNGSGSSIHVVGSSCTGGYWNTPSAWDNRISSSFNGCAHLRHWDGPNMSGSSESTYGGGTTDNLTFMNNRTESVSYYSS